MGRAKPINAILPSVVLHHRCRRLFICASVMSRDHCRLHPFTGCKDVLLADQLAGERLLLSSAALLWSLYTLDFILKALIPNVQ